MSATDRAITAAACTTVVVLAGVAGAISYSHMAELARLHGEIGWRAHAFPISVDGIEIVASLVLLAHHRADSRAGWLPWTALTAGTGASLAANIAIGASDPIGRLVAGWPAIALLLAIKLLAGLLDATPIDVAPTAPSTGTADGRATTSSGGPPVPDPNPVVPVPSVPVPHLPVPAVPVPAMPVRAVPVPAVPGGARHGPAPSRRSGPRRPAPVTGLSRPGRNGRAEASVPDGDGPPGAEELVEAARAVRDQLTAAGDRVNRRNLAAGLRASGHRIRNDRLSQLLVLIRDDTVAAAVDSPARRSAIPPPAGGGGVN
ncbi:DUF2637 domain-containing protein [Plantactinospora siamensis]|uniref:DUF2637 domain-containing protein n=1 Tax=Plantactinospora siamensis TaxID=555372 RepID=A0ABV6P1J5_9ACTN